MPVNSRLVNSNIFFIMLGNVSIHALPLFTLDDLRIFNRSATRF